MPTRRVPQGISTAKSVLDACRDAGLEGAEWIDTADVPFPFRGGVRLRDQAQIDPMPFLNSLVVELETHGGTLLQGVRACRSRDAIRSASDCRSG